MTSDGAETGLAPGGRKAGDVDAEATAREATVARAAKAYIVKYRRSEEEKAVWAWCELRMRIAQKSVEVGRSKRDGR